MIYNIASDIKTRKIVWIESMGICNTISVVVTVLQCKARMLDNKLTHL